jgi:hypothetical protein
MAYSRPTYTDQSRHHVSTHGHAAHCRRQSGKSRFRPTEGGQKFTDEVIAKSAPPLVQLNGRLRYESNDLGRNVGYDGSGNRARGGVVIVEGPNPASWSNYETNEVVTQYPR